MVLADGASVVVDALTVGASHVNAFVGTGLVDSNNDQRIDSHDALGSGAVGFYLGNVNFAMGLFSAKTSDTVTPKDKNGVSLSGVQWLALSASAGTVALVGLPSVTLIGSDFHVEINRVRYLAAGLDADTHTIDFTGTGDLAYRVRVGAQTYLDLALQEKGPLLLVQGTVDIEIANVISVSGSVSVKQFSL